MVPAKETAEEQLLRMIEGPPSASPKGSPGGFSPERLRDGLRDSIETLKRWMRGPQSRREGGDAFLAQLQLAGRVCWAVLAALGLYLIVDVAILQPAPPHLALAPQPPSGGSRVASVEEAAERSRAYRQTLVSRNPFRLEMGHATQAPSNQTAKSRLLELAGSLVVVGINRGAIPEALIEDSQDKRTHFVKVGDQINGMTISGIDQEGVTVTYEGEEAVIK